MDSFYPKSLFKLEDAYTYGITIAKKIIAEIEGRACGMPHDYGLLAQVVYNSGHGNYVETGTFFGASAIIAGMTKKHFGLSGKVICIDPLDGFYGTDRKDGKTGMIPTPEIVNKNLKKFGVYDITALVTEKSYPFPNYLSRELFSSAYIDGDHWDDLPTKDWLNLKDRTSRYIMFDNYDQTHPSVRNAVETAITDKEWSLVHFSSISLILEKNVQLKSTFRSKMTYDER